MQRLNDLCFWLFVWTCRSVAAIYVAGWLAMFGFFWYANLRGGLPAEVPWLELLGGFVISIVLATLWPIVVYAAWALCKDGRT